MLPLFNVFLIHYKLLNKICILSVIWTNELYFSYMNNNDKGKLFPVKITKNDREEFEKILSLVINKSGYRENYINLADQSNLHKTFSMDYRQIIGLFGYYLKRGKIEIADYFGSNILFKWINSDSANL